MGDKGDSDIANYMDDLMNYYVQMTAPLTSTFVSRGSEFLESPQKYVYSNPLYQDLASQDIWTEGIEQYALDPAKRTIEDQYQMAQEEILASMPSGGTLSSALAESEMEKATALGDLSKEIGLEEYYLALEQQKELNTLAQALYADEMSRAYGLGTMTPTQTMGALGSVAQAEAASAAAESSGKYGVSGDLGTAIGTIIAAGK